MSDVSGMFDDAAVAAGANPLSPDWVRSELRCTKAGLRVQPTVLDLTRLIHHDRANFSKISSSECAVRLVAPLVAARGDADTSVFSVMEEALAAAASAVGTTPFNNAEGVKILISWALEALRPSLERGSRVYLPSPVPPQRQLAEAPVAPEAQLAPASKAINTTTQSQQSQADAISSQQQKRRRIGSYLVRRSSSFRGGEDGRSNGSAAPASGGGHAAEEKYKAGDAGPVPGPEVSCLVIILFLSCSPFVSRAFNCFWGLFFLLFLRFSGSPSLFFVRGLWARCGWCVYP